MFCKEGVLVVSKVLNIPGLMKYGCAPISADSVSMVYPGPKKKEN
jgi:hypothetical protein